MTRRHRRWIVILFCALVASCGAIPAGAATETCTLGKTFIVMPEGDVERSGKLVDMMTKSGVITLDPAAMTASYDLRVTYALPEAGVEHRYKGTGALKRRTTKPDNDWMCELPKCAKKPVLEGVLRELKIDPGEVDMVEFLTIAARRDRSDGSVATEDDPDVYAHDIVRFLHQGKALGGGMFFQVMYTISFWPCR